MMMMMMMMITSIIIIIHFFIIYCAGTTAIRPVTGTAQFLLNEKVAGRYKSKQINCDIPKLQLNLANEKVLKTCKSLIELELVLNISVSLPMAFAVEAHRAEGQM